jgi:hypothetical protein
MAPFPAGGDPSGLPSAPGLPTTWTGLALGQAAPISPDAAALVGYVSPNQSRPADGDLEEDEELARLRGTARMDEEVGKLTAWTTRKDYPTLVGISLPIRDWVGEDYHEIQFWEETTKPIMLEYPAAEMYDWLVNRLQGRAEHGILPSTYSTRSRDFQSRHIAMAERDELYTNYSTSWGGSMTDIPVRVQIEYPYGYAKLGMGEAYTLRMHAQEFWILTRKIWSLYPARSHTLLVDGTIRHKTTNDPTSFHEALRANLIDSPPVKIQEDVEQPPTPQLTKQGCVSIGLGPDRVSR